MLLKLGRNAGEIGVERAADRIDRRNNHNGNASSDQTIFDRGSSRIVFQKSEDFGHLVGAPVS